MIPCLNERLTIAEAVVQAKAGFTDWPGGMEVVVADNGSTDGSGAEAGALGRDGRHLDQVEVVDPRFAQRVIEGRERRQAFGGTSSEVKQAGKKFAGPGTIVVRIGRPLTFDAGSESKRVTMELQKAVEEL